MFSTLSFPPTTRKARSLQRQAIFVMLVSLLLGSVLFSWSCTGGGPCQGEISNTTTNTTGLTCQSRCECNNQAYEGYCISGKCVAFARQACTQQGTAVPCKLFAQDGQKPACEWGERICKPDYLQSVLWGDCNAYTTVPEEGKDPSTAKQQCTNNRDDDCDGKIDDADDGCTQYCKRIGEERPCYEGAPKETLNQGTCTVGLQRCQADSTWGKCTQQTLPQNEVCDRLDNDCDGKTDEGLSNCPEIRCKEGESIPCYTETQGCQRDASGNFHCKGLCLAGKRTCQNGSFGACEGQTSPKTEDCKDTFDNNCDGQVNEGCLCEDGKTQECYTGPESTMGIGACQKGQQICKNGIWGPCNGAQAPTPERCNQIDDDCDGTVDNRCGSCSDGALRSCINEASGAQGPCQQGIQLCYNGVWSQCFSSSQAKPEICDGIDNDCNGKVDDDCTSCAPGFSRECTDRLEEPEKAGVGNCRAGIQICRFDKNKQSYDFSPCQFRVLPTREVCANNQDDDCDGEVDEKDCDVCKVGEIRHCYDLLPASAAGVGACNFGVQVCQYFPEKPGNDFGKCIGATGPNPSGEIALCDGIDNDCNGMIDEGSCVPDGSCLPYQSPGEPVQYRCFQKCVSTVPCHPNDPNQICTPQGHCNYCKTDADCSALAGSKCTGNTCQIP